MILLDTHVLVWWLTDGAKISRAAKLAIGRAAKESVVIASAISVLEITTAARRGRLQFSIPVDQWLADAGHLPELRFEPVSADIARLAGSFGEEMHGDPADRIIAATALHLGCPLVTADDKLRACPAVRTLW